MLTPFTMMSPTPSASFGAVGAVAREDYTQHLISRRLKGALSSLLAKTFSLGPVLVYYTFGAVIPISYCHRKNDYMLCNIYLCKGKLKRVPPDRDIKPQDY